MTAWMRLAIDLTLKLNPREDKMAIFFNTSLKTASNISGDTFIFDNKDLYFIESTGGSIDHNTIIFGDGRGDVVQTDATFKNIEFNTIIFGDGPGDKVTSQNGDVKNNTIIFGNGNNDSVSAPGGSGAINNNTITFGNGNGDHVSAGPSGVIGNKITFGSGDSDSVFSPGTMQNNIITFGDGAGDTVQGIGNVNVDNNIITFGNGADDKFQVQAEINNNIMTFGDGTGDSLIAGLGGSNNVITFGNGNNITISLGDFFPSPIINNMITVGNGSNSTITLNGTAGGGNTIVTGTGFNVVVAAGVHNTRDTFGFSLGTSGAGFTTVSGAMDNDLITASGTALGNNLVSSDFTDATTLREFITTLNFQENDSTAIGYNQSVNDTFIVTLAADGQLGAIVISGQFLGSSITDHVLTLLQ
jgi:hypothetical protein